MRIYDPPHKALKLEEDVGDVEYRQQPAVSIAFEIEVFLHASNFGIANVGAIKKGQKICVGPLSSARRPLHTANVPSSDAVSVSALT